MCTMGMLGERKNGTHTMLFCAKTADTPPTALRFHQITASTGMPILCLQNGWQEGVNAGMNESGLVVMSAYLGFVVPFGAGKGGRDTRGLANLHALAQHSTVAAAAEGLAAFLERRPSTVGGIHFAVDGQGGMAVVEHADGRIALELAHQPAEDGRQLRARGNDAQLLGAGAEAASRLTARDREDRQLRQAAMEAALRASNAGRWLDELRQILGSHRYDAAQQHGQICVHQYNNEGARSNDLTPHTTETAVIFDVLGKRMIYSEGPPCEQRWKSLAFNKYGQRLMDTTEI